jgi:hypothetical protein
MRDAVDWMASDEADLFELARQGAYDAALRTLAKQMTGQDGYLALSGLALIGVGGAAAIVSLSGGPVTGNHETINDPVLGALGLALARYEAQATEVTPLSALSPILHLRLGLLARSLDMTHFHLLSRRSFGQPVLKHQLVRADFARVHAQIQQCLGEVALLQEWPFVRDDSVRACVDRHHQTVTHASTMLNKLMGGQAFLLNGIAALDHLSLVLGSLYPASDRTAVRSDAMAGLPTGGLQLEGVA